MENKSVQNFPTNQNHFGLIKTLCLDFRFCNHVRMFKNHMKRYFKMERCFKLQKQNSSCLKCYKWPCQIFQNAFWKCFKYKGNKLSSYSQMFLLLLLLHVYFSLKKVLGKNVYCLDADDYRLKKPNAVSLVITQRKEFMEGTCVFE